MKNVAKKSVYMMAVCLVVSGNVSAEGIDAWQEKQLLAPTKTLLVAEANGRVTIYDGMPIETVERALDEQFDRIDSMMFTRIRHTTEEGEVVEDDGC